MRHLILLLTTLWTINAHAADDEAQRGAYLVSLLGCGACHTQGVLIGESSAPWLAGSNVGIAYGPEVSADKPAVVFPSNLTSDKKTGIGDWSKEEIVTAIRGGIDAHSAKLANVMPWLNYSQLSDTDASAIATYLMTLPPVEKEVPGRVISGTTSEHRFVRIGVYVFSPEPGISKDAKAPEAVRYRN